MVLIIAYMVIFYNFYLCLITEIILQLLIYFRHKETCLIYFFIEISKWIFAMELSQNKKFSTTYSIDSKKIILYIVMKFHFATPPTSLIRFQLDFFENIQRKIRMITRRHEITDTTHYSLDCQKLLSS